MGFLLEAAANLSLPAVVALWGAGVILVLAGLWVGLAWHFASRLVRPRMASMQKTAATVIESGEATPELLVRFHETVLITVRDGYRLGGAVLPAERARPAGTPGAGAAVSGPAGQSGSSPATRTIILCHGHTWTWHGMLKYLQPFLDGQWNIVVYNSRGHGGNTSHPPTFGATEVADLVDVLAWVRRRFPATLQMGVFGESMGSAVILQALGQGLPVDFAICDCSFSDLAELAAFQLRRSHVPGFLVPPLLGLASRFVRRIAGFDLAAIKPARAAAGLNLPLLVMHGAKDYHATARTSDPVRYDAVVREFLDGLAAGACPD